MFTPSLPSMRAFLAAVRHENFSAAAEELNVTQGAISHKIKDLEVRLGVDLFRRTARGTIPTEAARGLARAIEGALLSIHEALEEVMPSEIGQSIRISVLPGFALQWLFPRLIDFDQRFPGTSMSLETTEELANIAAGDSDLAIRYGRGNYAGVSVERLFDDHIFPVCSPSFLSDNGPIHSPSDLLSHTLLIDDTRSIDGYSPSWQRWFGHVGVPFHKDTAFKRFGQSNMVIQAALAGQGIALGRSALVVDDLISGALVIPVKKAFPSGFGHFLVSPKNRSRNPSAREFCRWIKAQAELSQTKIHWLLRDCFAKV
jgi:LysR family glycine cleavage system transcriptional activator